MNAFQKQTHQFTRKDRWGDEHVYTCALHGAREGTKLALQVTALVSGSIGELIKSYFKPGQKIADALDTEVDDLLGGIDFAPVIEKLQVALADEKNDELVMAILSKTLRDDKDIVEDYDRMYRANYGEAALALWEVVRINGFFPLLDTFLKSSQED